MNTTKEFTAADHEVRDIAAVFALRRWEWTNRNGKTVDAYVPKASDIAATLNGLYDTAKAMPDSENSGNCRTGRLWLESTNEGYGDEIAFGISYSRSALGDDLA